VEAHKQLETQIHQNCSNIQELFFNTDIGSKFVDTMKEYVKDAAYLGKLN
jgi:hypothetical protein